MLARVAQWNVSIFREEGKLPIDDVIRAYLRYVSQNCPVNVIFIDADRGYFCSQEEYNYKKVNTVTVDVMC